MYSIFLSKIDQSFNQIENKLKRIIKPGSKVAIFPWAFPNEIDSYRLNNEYFKKGERKYCKYVDKLLQLGISEKDVIICDCYAFSTQKLKRIINKSDILVFPGGNPEMLFYNILHRTETFYTLKKSNKIIIGESAGAVMQFERYFATTKNNYYNYLAFYDGFGIIDDNFYIDVHTTTDDDYISELQMIANQKGKKIYAIPDEGCMIYNRSNHKIEYKSNVIEIAPKED